MHILSLFPQILFLAPLGTTLLRISAGLMIVYMGYHIINSREEISRARLPIVGHLAPSLWLVSGSLTCMIGVGLIVGYFTQAFAIAGALLTIKHLLGLRHYASLLPLSTSGYILLLVICLSLIVSGAGALAFDLPL